MSNSRWCEECSSGWGCWSTCKSHCLKCRGSIHGREDPPEWFWMIWICCDECGISTCINHCRKDHFLFVDCRLLKQSGNTWEIDLVTGLLRYCPAVVHPHKGTTLDCERDPIPARAKRVPHGAAGRWDCGGQPSRSHQRLHQVMGWAADSAVSKRIGGFLHRVVTNLSYWRFCSVKILLGLWQNEGAAWETVVAMQDVAQELVSARRDIAHSASSTI